MNVSRIYQAKRFDIHQRVQLDDRASHHLAHVLRAKIGDQLTLFNGMPFQNQFGEFKAVIVEIHKKNIDVEILSFEAKHSESSINICLAQGVARGEKMDLIIQKATELGVTQIVPLITERCNVRLDEERYAKRLLHWQAVAISACEQSGRNRLPELVSPIRLEDWLKSKTSTDLSFVLSPHVTGELPATMPTQSTNLLIGPEGGLSDHEVEAAIAQNFLPLRLGPRILRTETATIAAITVLQYAYGDLQLESGLRM